MREYGCFSEDNSADASIQMTGYSLCLDAEVGGFELISSYAAHAPNP